MGKYRPRGELGLPTYKGNEAEYHRLYWAKRKAEAQQLLGGVCCECGFADPRALQIDHIDGKGHLVKCPGGKRYQWAAIRDIYAGNTANYQLLCANCHAIKTWEE
jgi:hypothetical protein